MRRFAAQSILGLAGLLCLGLALQGLTPSSGRRDATANPILQLLGGGMNFVFDIGTQVGWVVLPVIAVCLLIRDLPHLATFVVVSAVGSALLTSGGPLVASLLNQFIPAYPVGGNGVFTNGSLEMTVTGAVLLLVVLPVVPSRARTWVIAATAACLAAFDAIRIATGSTDLWSTAGAWLLGVAWVGVSASAFRRWQQPETPRRPLHQGLYSRHESRLLPAPVGDKPLPGGARGWARLFGAWVLIGAILTGMGLLVTQVLTAVQRLDSQVTEWFVSIRSDGFTTLATVLGTFGSTAGIIAALLIAAPLALALTRRWAPTVFLLSAVIGETTLYLTAAFIVGRPRPSVDHLSQGVPPTSSFPSGHVAASVAAYGAVALLLWVWAKGWVRYAGILVAPLIVFGVACARMYWGVHFASDAVAGALFACAWLAACWYAVRPFRGSPHGQREDIRGRRRPPPMVRRPN